MSADRPARPRFARFGVFDVDLREGALRKKGARLRLQQQPLRILRLLVERDGEVVTRDELRSALWPADTFVDFEHNLNSAVKRLRAALGDSAATPRFIETLPRQGYRWLAPIEFVADPDVTPTPAAPLPSEPPSLAREMPPSRHRLVWPATVVGVLALAAIVWVTARSNSTERGSDTAITPLAPSVAVLPFVAGNAAEGSPDEYLAFGMTDALIGELSRVGALKVISQTSVMQYKGAQKTLPVIARELGVSTVVEGSVFRESGQVRMTVQLIDARTDTHLWTQTYTSDPETVLSTQRQLAREVAGLIRSRLLPSDRSTTPSFQQTNPAAYEAYVKGRYYLQRPDEASMARGRAFFEQSIAADSNFAPAHVGLSNYFVVTDAVAPAEAMPRAKTSAGRALAIDPASAPAHASLAFAHYFGEWDWAAAEREFARAIELDPGDARTHRWHALFLSSMGRHATAAEEIQRAIELDPVSISAFDSAGAVWSNARRFDKVLEQAGRIRDLSPADPRSFMHFAVGYLHLGRFAEAVDSAQKGVEASGRHPPSCACSRWRSIARGTPSRRSRRSPSSTSSRRTATFPTRSWRWRICGCGVTTRRSASCSVRTSAVTATWSGRRLLRGSIRCAVTRVFRNCCAA